MNEVECAKLEGRINTQNQRVDSMNERLVEAIDDIHDIKDNMVSLDNFNKLVHDVSKIREKQVDKLSIDLVLKAVEKSDTSSKEANALLKDALNCIKKRTSLIGFALVFLFLLIVWLSFVVAGENALPMLSNAFKFFLKVIL